MRRERGGDFETVRGKCCNVQKLKRPVQIVDAMEPRAASFSSRALATRTLEFGSDSWC